MSIIRSFHGAVTELARGTPMKQRLVAAYTTYLSQIDAALLPQALATELGAVCAALTASKPLSGETAIQATVRKLSPADADAIAGRIVTLFGLVTRSRALRVVESAAESSTGPRRPSEASPPESPLPRFARADA